MAQQTAVEYLFMMLANHNILNHKVLADNKHLTELTYRIKTDAKQMEKERHDKWNEFLDAEKVLGISDVKTIERIQWYYNQYYNETFGKQ